MLPKRALTRYAGWRATRRWGPRTTKLIRGFVAKYGVDMSEAANPDIASYPSFNEFFTRALKPGVRPLAAADLICPVDGAISQFGPIRRDQIFQPLAWKIWSRRIGPNWLIAPSTGQIRSAAASGRTPGFNARVKNSLKLG